MLHRRRHRGRGGRGPDHAPRHGPGGLRGAAAGRGAGVRAGGGSQADGAHQAAGVRGARAWCTSSTRCRALPVARSGGLRCASGGRTGERATVDAFLIAIPPLVVYLTVGLVVGIESLGVPLPGEIVLVSAGAAVVAARARRLARVDRAGRDGRCGDRRLHRLRHRTPLRHGPVRVGRPEDAAALRAGARDAPPSGSSPGGACSRCSSAGSSRCCGSSPGRWPARCACTYPRFLLANVLGGICWAAGTTFAVYLLGIVAERWLQRFSWIGLVVAVVAGLTIGA